MNCRGPFAELLSLNSLCFAPTGGGAQTASVGPDCQGALSADAVTAQASPPRPAQTPPTSPRLTRCGCPHSATGEHGAWPRARKDA